MPVPDGEEPVLSLYTRFELRSEGNMLSLCVANIVVHVSLACIDRYACGLSCAFAAGNDEESKEYGIGSLKTRVRRSRTPRDEKGCTFEIIRC